MKHKTIYYISFILLVVGFISACSKNDSSENAARLRIKLTGTPADTINELMLDIQGIEVSLLHESSTAGDWTPLEFSGKTYDMKKQTNGKMIQLSDQYFLAKGVIRKVKVIFGTNNSIRTTGGVRKLIVPNELQGGVVIDNVVVNLYANVICSALIDMNNVVSLDKATGNYLLNPFIRVYPESLGHAMRGSVSPKEAYATVMLKKGKESLLSFPEQDGMFMFKGLQEGEWEIHVLANKSSGFRDTIFKDTVFADKIRELKPKPIVLNPKQAPPAP